MKKPDKAPLLIGPSHDIFFRGCILGTDRLAKEFLKWRLPDRYARRVDWHGEIHRTQEKRVSAGGRAHMADAQFRLPMKDGGRMTVIIEHKSAVDVSTPSQVAVYLATAFRDNMLSGRARRGMSEPIVALVYAHAARAWETPELFEDCFEPPLHEGRSDAWFRYHLTDMRSMPAAELPGDAGLRGLVLLSKWATTDAGPETIGDEHLGMIFLALNAEGDVRDNAWLYFWERLNLTPEQSIDAVRRLLPEKEKEHMAMVDHMIEKYGDTWFTNGFEKGLREGELKGELKGRREGELKGRREGRREGELKGLREGELKGEVGFLAKVLRQRFGDLPEDALRHIDAADDEERLRMGVAAGSADSLAEVFGPRLNGKLQSER